MKTFINLFAVFLLGLSLSFFFFQWRVTKHIDDLRFTLLTGVITVDAVERFCGNIMAHPEQLEKI